MHYFDCLCKRFALFMLLATLGLAASAREITNNSHKINGTGIDEHGVYVEFYVAYYHDKGDDNEMYSSTWWMELNGTKYNLFETSLKHQNDASAYWCYFGSFDYPMYVRPNDSSGKAYYYPGQARWNGAYDRVYRWQKVSCTCQSLADAYVRVYLPVAFWGKSPTFKMTADWDGSDYDGQKSFGSKTLSNPDYYRETNPLTYEPSSTTGKMKVNMQFKGILDNNYAYTPTASGMTLTDKSLLDVVNGAYDKKFVGEYTASKTDQKGSITVVCTQAKKTNYTQTLQIYATESYPKTLTFPLEHSYSWTWEPTLGACTYVKNLVVTPKQWTKSFQLQWGTEVKNNITAGTYYIYRYKMVGNNPTEGKFIKEKLSYNTTTYNDTDADLQYDVTYRYIVFFAANTWNNITSPITGLGETKDATITRSFPIKLKVNGNDNNIDLSWSYTAENKVTFTIYRKYGTNSWTELHSFEPSSTSAATYTDTEVAANTLYSYYIQATVMGKSFTSDVGSARIGKMTKADSFVASKGEYTDRVKLMWTATQVGTTATQYRIYRKLIDDDDENAYAQIYLTEGTGQTYYYEDGTALSGQYYKYKVEVYSRGAATASDTLSNLLESDGFCTAKGIVNGRVTYGTGTAVPDAKVILTANDKDEGLAQFHSMEVKNRGGGITIPITASMKSSMFNGNKPFSIEMWIRPYTGICESSGSTKSVESACLFTINGQFGIDAVPVSGDNTRYKLFMNLPGDNNTKGNMKLEISSAAFSHLTLSNDGTGWWKMRLIDGDSIQTDSCYCSSAPSLNSSDPIICLGYPKSINGAHTFMGYIDEFRLWSKCLTDDEIIKYACRTLSGSETGLKVYFPLDEGIKNQETAYDYSKTGGVANGNHGTIKLTTDVSDVVPTESQLSLHGVTDEQGNFTVMGVPFVGEGTSYTIRPTLGIHEFSPKYLTRFVNGNSLNHSGVDFEDVSSFSVSGLVTYENTNYPVDGCNIYVDGTICAKDGTPVETEDGKFTVSVPIGAHYITIKKTGHEFVNAGRYPADPNGVGLTHEFTKVISKGQPLTFYDNTLVNFSGRVVGGDIEGEKALGFGLSKNNLGVTEIVMRPAETKYSINFDNGTGENSTSTLSCKSSTEEISSKSWRGAGDQSSTIFIHTDSLTGEFSVMVPPLLYNVESMNVLKDENKEISFSGMPVSVDLTNPQSTSTDSLGTDKKYEYHYALKKTYHSAATFTVQQSDNTMGAFGIENYDLWENNKKYVVLIYDKTKDPIYNYGYPLFISGDSYTFNLSGYEKYINADNQAEDIVPLDGTIITISNALSESQSVFNESGTVDGKNVSAGDVCDLKENELSLDSLGKATYTWTAGLPNISGNYTRNISMAFEIDGRKYQWNTTGLDAIILGSLSTGNNFVTSGPDHLAMILRDPPGTNSSASWTSGTVKSYSSSTGGCWSVDASTTFTAKLGASISTVSGIGVAKIDDIESRDDFTAGTHVTSEGEDANTVSVSISSSKTVSTKDTPEYVGAGGDVFIGTATNIIFGEANNVGLYRNPDKDTVSLEMKSIFTVGQKFGTTFQYDQIYIENTLLPNLEKMRNSMLKYYGNDPVPANTSKVLKYVSKVPESDPNFGSSNSDEDVWGDRATAPGETLDGPSYYTVSPEGAVDTRLLLDSVNWCNLQIEAWKGYLAQNEEEKVKAFEEREKYLECNLSFDTGADVEQSYETENTSGSTYEHTTGASVILNNETGIAINSTGVLWTVETENGGSRHLQKSQDTTAVTGFSYKLSEDGDDDALTVDVYNYGSYSRIFRTRGGQTCGPYEGEVTTKYYKPGTVIMEATQQIEVPEIEAVPAIVSNVPSGSSATFTLRLYNQSEIGEDVYYKLLMIDESNPDGAIIKIDGQPLTEGRNIKVPAGETVTKSLQLSQSNYSILSYENIGIVLASQVQYDPTSTWDQIADTCWISAYFVPSASSVTMQLSNTLINTKSVTEASPDPMLNITFKDFDRNYDKQKAFRIQYRQQGDNDWTLLREYLLDSTKVISDYQQYLEDVASVTYPLNMKSMEDGEYTFRVLSACAYGNNEEVTVTSEEIAITKDMKRPQALGTPKPSTGILTQGDDISITFNEDINQNMLTSSNFKVTAQLNEATIANDVAICATGGQTAAASTDADINLSGQDFAMDMWINYSSAGTLVAHGNGTNKFKVEVDAGGHLVIDIDTSAYTSAKTIQKDKWCYLALSYTKSGGLHYLDALCANDASTTMLFSNEKVDAYTGNGRLSVLNGITASLHDLTLWDNAVVVDVLQSEMHTTKKPSTEGLIGYWRFDEGQGLSAADKARNRNMAITSNNGWYMNVENKAVQFDGSNYISLNTSACPVPSTDDYAVELWFKADSKQDGTATIFSVGSNLVLRLAANGQMELVSDSDVYKIGSAKYLDNQWHNFALNVLRNGNATVYIDGQSVAQTAGSNIADFESDAMVLGAKRSYSAEDGYTYSDFFNGTIDDIRIWNASLNASVLNSNKDTRLAGTEDGLVAYYPFEKIAYDEGNQPYAAACLSDKTGNTVDAISSSSTVTYVTGPSQRPAKSVSGVGFSYVASERMIVINLNESADLIEGTTIDLTVKNVYDMNGNNCEPIKWSAYVNQNQLVWNESDVSIKAESGSVATFSATVANNSAVTEQWTVSGLPSWLDADMTQGTLTALTSRTINFTVSDAVQIGRHDVTLYLSGNNGINVPLLVCLTVIGDEPDWSVNYTDYSDNMTMFGQIKHLGKLSDNTGDKVAAFIDGECRGVASPVYYPRYDSYFTQLMVYANSGYDSGKKVEFKIWNAAEGKVYPVVSFYSDGGSAASDVKYTANSDYGTTAAPCAWNSEDKIEETIVLSKGWNWTSLYVDADDKSVGSLLGDINANGNSVHGFNSFAQSDGTEWTGNLKQLNIGEMYMIKSVESDSLTMTGKEVDAAATSLTIESQWNWIGLNASYRIGINSAFAGLAPEDGDIVKSQSAFAIYDGYEWIGNLSSLAPGSGYMYKSQASVSKTFTYPGYTSVAGLQKAAGFDEMGESASDVFDFDGSSYSKYPANMTIVARVMDGDKVVTDACVGVVACGECREAQTVSRGGLVFLTIPGDKAEMLRFEVVSKGTRYRLVKTAAFSANAHLGTLDEPYILQIGGVTDAGQIGADTEESGTMYNATGIKVGEDYKGLVIKQGEKYIEMK